MTEEQIVLNLEEMAGFKSLNLGCKNVIHNAIDLINRQKAEIERLKNILRKASTEPERLRTTHDRVREFDEIRSRAKSEAVKEFAERIKNMSEDCTDYGQEYVLCEDVDKLVKEMVGDE